jgi:hypothetical protein
MAAPGNDLILILLTLSVFLSSAYAIGRIHQWERCGLERDEAYQLGYDKASRAIIGMMTGRHLGSRREHQVTELEATPHLHRRGRHVRRGAGDRTNA